MTFKTMAIAAAVSAAAATGAAAAPIYATGATIVTDGPRGTANDRDDIGNALGDSLGDFFELGYGATVDFTFGTNFTGPGNVVEVTFVPTSVFPETADIFVGFGGTFTFLTTVVNSLAQGPVGFEFDFSGVFDTLRFVDTSPVIPGTTTGGFDVDRVSVSPVPLPATGLLLVGALGALGFARRRTV